MDVIDDQAASALAEAFDRRDRQEATRLALPLYELDSLPE
jgi:hypothetical protein